MTSTYSLAGPTIAGRDTQLKASETSWLSVFHRKCHVTACPSAEFFPSFNVLRLLSVFVAGYQEEYEDAEELGSRIQRAWGDRAKKLEREEKASGKKTGEGTMTADEANTEDTKNSEVRPGGEPTLQMSHE